MKTCAKCSTQCNTWYSCPRCELFLCRTCADKVKYVAENDFYALLQVLPNAEPDVIDAAYKGLVRKYHPDKNPGDPAAAAKSVLLNDAGEFLRHPALREVYDEKRQNYLAEQIRSRDAEREAREREAREREAREREAREREARERQSREREARERQSREREARERQSREREARERQSRERQAREREACERQSHERQAREREARERLSRDREARERQSRESEAREREGRERQTRERVAHEREARQRQRGNDLKPHRGARLLTWGIIGFFLCPLISAPIVWYLARADLKGMRAGGIDPSGKGTTHAACIIGMVGTLGQLLYLGLFFLLCAGSALQEVMRHGDSWSAAKAPQRPGNPPVAASKPAMTRDPHVKQKEKAPPLLADIVGTWTSRNDPHYRHGGSPYCRYQFGADGKVTCRSPSHIGHGRYTLLENNVLKIEWRSPPPAHVERLELRWVGARLEAGNLIRLNNTPEFQGWDLEVTDSRGNVVNLRRVDKNRANGGHGVLWFQGIEWNMVDKVEITPVPGNAVLSQYIVDVHLSAGGTKTRKGILLSGWLKGQTDAGQRSITFSSIRRIVVLGKSDGHTPSSRNKNQHGARQKAIDGPVKISSKEKTDHKSFPATSPADQGKMGQAVAKKKPLQFEVETSILQPGMNAKHQRRLEAGNTYTIDLVSSEFDPLLRLLDGNGNEIDLDDDGGQGQNSRIICRPTRTEEYHLEVKSVSKPTGSYALIIDKNRRGTSKLPNIMTHFFSGAYPVQWYPCNMKEGGTYTLEVMSSEFPPSLGLASNRRSSPFIKDLGRTNGWARLFYRARRTGEFAAMVWPGNRGASGYFTLIYYEGHKKTPLFPNLKTFVLPAGRKSCKIPQGVCNRGSTYGIDLVSSEFDPYLRLLDEQGQEVGADDNSGHGNGARVIFKPNQTSSYWLEVNSFVESNEIQRFAWNVEENGRDIAYLPGLRTGRLQAGQESKKYKWYLAATDTYTINAISTDFAPVLRLLDSENKELLADNNGQKERYAQIVCQPKNSGIYELEVSSLRGGRGSFLLIAEKK